MNNSRHARLRSLRRALLPTGLTVMSSLSAFAKDTITDDNTAGPIEVPPASLGDFHVGGPYNVGTPSEVPNIDLILASSDLGEWWVNGNQTDPWTALSYSNTFFAYHHRADVPAGGAFWAAWSLAAQYFDYTSQFRHTDGQIPNGSIMSFGLSDSGNPYPVDLAVWNFPTFSGMSGVDVPGGLDLTNYTGPSAADFPGTEAFTWKSYEITGGAVNGVPSGTDLFWTIKLPLEPITDYVVFVQLPPTESLDADGGSFTQLTANDMAGLGVTDEIVFNWTIDAKSDIIGDPNPAYGDNILPPVIGDTVWIDLDRDGVQDPNEAGIEGVLVELLDASGSPVLDVNNVAITATTDANGNYELTGFDAGTYTVRFTEPGGRTVVSADQGGDDTLDSDAGVSGVTGLIDMTGSPQNDTVDAGFLPLGSAIGDTVWQDIDADGIQDPGEPGIEGVVVKLLDGNGDPVVDGGGNPITTTTDANGNYFFDGLTSGTYIVEFEAPEFHVASAQNAGGDDALDSDIDTTTLRSDPVVLGTDVSDVTVDAGFYELATIGDFVFNDVNGDGKQDAGEPGLPGVTVKLLDAGGNPVLDANNDPITTTTDASGAYLFEGLAPGDYIIEFVTPDGFTTVNADTTTDDLDSDYDPLNGQTPVISVGPGEDITDVDAGFDPVFGNFARIGDRVWNDLDGDGIQDPGEPGVEGVVVKLLDASGNPILDAGGNETTVTTDANGDYLFIVDPDFDYILEFVPAPAMTLTTRDAGTDDAIDSDADAVTFRTDLIAVANDEIRTDIDAGVVGASIGDTVWVDLDRDGVQDPSEVGLAGVTVELLDESGNPVLDGSGQPITATTDAEGNYEITGFPPGIYTLRFTAPEGYTSTGGNLGGDDTLDSDIDALGVTGPIDMTGPGSDFTVDAGYLPIGSAIGDTVFNDADGDGIQDPGEEGVAGVTVKLLDEFGNPVTDGSGQPITTTTDSNGNYYFDGLSAGNYIVEVVPPTDWTVSPQNAGGDDALDSDISPTTNRTAVIILGTDASDTTVDAGLIEPGSIGDYVFNDADGDGKQDAGEIGLPGVVVNLLDATGTTVLATTTTDASGFYQFDGLPSGDYVIEFVTPDGFTTVGADKTTDDLDSDYDPVTGQVAVTLGQGEDLTTVDAGFDPPGSFAQIGDKVWEDYDGDGIQDPGEPGVEGVVVKLLDASGTPITDADGNETTVTTDANGNYLFIVNPNIDYILEFVPPPGMTLTTADAGTDEALDSDADELTFRTGLIAVANNEIRTDIDVGVVGASIGDQVWVDLDGDGVQDANEAGMPGVLVELLDEAGNPVLDGFGNPITAVTDSNGNYELTGFPPGIYTVRFTAPDGETPTGTDLGGDDTLDSDIDALGVTGPIDMTGPGSNTTVDAGFLPAGSAIGDIVFNDSDADGIQDPGELGLAGVTVNLLDSSGNPVLDGSGQPITTTTDANGAYYFDGLDAGDYIVEVVPPVSFAVTLQNEGADDTVDSDVDPATGRSGVIALGPDEVNSTVDAGLYELASIGDFVFSDLDGDGRQDAAETGIPGVVVSLLDGNGDPVLDENNQAVTTTTDLDGFYEFAGLPPGDYILHFATPDGFTTVQQDRDQGTGPDLATDSDYDVTTGRTDVITLTPGDDNVDVDAGFKPPANFARIGDTVWSDLDGDGIEDPGEPGVEGVIVKLLDASGNPVLDSSGNETTVTTDADGNYFLIVDPDFDYILEFVPAPATTLTIQDAGSDDTLDSDADEVTFRTGLIAVADNEVRIDIDAGLIGASIGDTVWVDLDGDGVQDSNEAGLGGVLVELLDAAGSPVLDGSGNRITATTDANGHYELTGFPPGEYKLLFTAPAGYTATTADQGGDDTLDSDIDFLGETGVIDMTGPGSNYTVDAGFLPIDSAIGDVVFNDLDGDGEQDSGEGGVEGVTVNLLDGNGDPVLDGSSQPITTTTGANGGYYFDGLDAGDYIVEVVPPSGFALSPQDQGGDDNLDSDIDPATGRSSVITLAEDEVNTTVDAGLYELASIGDFVWNDTDNDGRQDAGEVGLPGVTVNLLDATGTTVLATTTTDASGAYLFDGLAPGDYIIEFVTPDGFQAVQQDRDQGDPAIDIATDSDYDVTTGRTDVITLAQGENNIDVDAGFDPIFGNFAQIGDTVWSDLNNNGIQDPGEPGVEGVVVKLLDASGSPILDAAGNETTVTTDANGNYLFIVDPDFDYILEFVPPAGGVFTTQDVGAGLNETEDSDVSPATNRTGLIELANDEVNNDIDAGLKYTNAVGDFVWIDADGDGVQDSGETGLDGVTVTLLDSNGNPTAFTATTANGGAYEFLDVPDGTYSVRYELPGGSSYVFSPQDSGVSDALDSDADPATGETAQFTLGSNEVDFTLDAGVYEPADFLTLGDTVFNDLDNDGEYDFLDGETGIDGVTLDLYWDANGDGDFNDPGEGTVFRTTVTSGGGLYRFEILEPGNYQVVIPASNFSGALSSTTLSSTTTDTQDNQQDNDDNGTQTGGPGSVVSSPVINLALLEEPGIDGDPTVDFGFVDPATLVGVGNLVYIDENGNGVYDDGVDTPVEDVEVQLWTPGGDGQVGGGDDVLVATTVTGNAIGGTSGCYEFLNLPPGDYFVEIPASEFATGQPLYRAVTLTGEGGDTGTNGTSDDNSDENGQDGSPHTVDGALSGVINLAVGAEPTGSEESGKNGGGDDAFDANVDYTIDFGFAIGKAQLYVDYQSDTGLTPGTADGQPVADGSGNGGNPDGDINDNLLEHAVCDTPNSGVPNHPAFCTELADPATGQVDAMFVRPEGIRDVIYTLKGYNALGGTPFTIALIPAGDPAMAPFTVTSNGDGTETVTYPNVQVAAGFTDPDFGLVELCVSLDVDQDGTPDTVTLASDGSSVEVTSSTQLFGWQCTDFNAAQCASFGDPFTGKTVFTGTIDSNTGGTIDVSTSANGADVGAVITGGGTHYLQVTSGPLEGERFDIASAGVNSLTLVNDPDIFADADAVESLNTSDGVPADNALDGATFQVLPHRTLDSLFDKNGVFSGLESSSPSLAAKILLYDNRDESPGFRIYMLIDTGTEVKWVRTNDLLNLADQGGTRIDRLDGAYIHPMLGGLKQCSTGMVASHDLAMAFNEGYNLAGPPYPKDQAPVDADPGAEIDGRNMQLATGFVGDVTPTGASQLFFWNGDMAVDDELTYTTGYWSRMLLDGGGMERWINANDPSITDVGADEILPSHRAVSVKMRTGTVLKPHIYPEP